MLIGVSMQLRAVFKYVFLVLIPYCWSVALEKKTKKNKNKKNPTKNQQNTKNLCIHRTFWHAETEGRNPGGQSGIIVMVKKGHPLHSNFVNQALHEQN